jgi:CHAD domain-containing protein
MATVVREIERKYDLAAGSTAALDAVRTMTGTAGIAAVSRQGEQLLDAVYYDTADLRLIGAGITLRRRTGGGDAGWHLKLPAGADTRDEIRLPLDAPSGKREATPHARTDGAVPEELAALVRARTRGAALAPVVRIQTSRRVLGLLDGVGQALAELAADHVSAQPAAGAAQQPPLTRGSPAGEVVLAYVRGQVAAIWRYDPLVRLDEPDAVHQMRVATRRARSALQAFGGIIERDATRQLCAELKWLAAELGPARDGEVLLARLTAELAVIPPALIAGPVQARITGCFTAELAQARQTALAALDGQRYLRLLDDLDALLADPPLTPRATRKAGKALGKPVRQAARRLQRALAAVPAAEDRDAAIHEARKATKRARYAAEAAVPALGSTASRQAAQAKELQQLLGDHHDSVVARTVLLDLAGKARAAGEDTFTYGLMHQRQACQATTMEQALPRFTARGFVNHQG